MARLIPNLQQFLTLSLISLILFTLDSFNLLVFPKTGLYFLTNPISLSLYQIKQNFTNQFQFLFSARTAAQENRALKEQMGNLLAENSQLRTKLAESESLIDQQNSLDPKTYNLIPARPIGLTRYLIIDKGGSDGISIGKAVVTKNNLLGKIINVSPKSSTVELISDPNFKLSAFSLNKDGKARGIISGQFGTFLLMDKILHQEPIALEDLVYSEGLESYLPRGLILGKVVEVGEEQTQIFKQAKVEPIFDVKDLNLVFIVND